MLLLLYCATHFKTSIGDNVVFRAGLRMIQVYLYTRIITLEYNTTRVCRVSIAEDSTLIAYTHALSSFRYWFLPLP